MTPASIAQQQKEHVKGAMRGEYVLPGIDSIRKRRESVFQSLGLGNAGPLDPRWLDEQAAHLRSMAKQVDKLVTALPAETNNRFEQMMTIAVALESIADDLDSAAMDLRFDIDRRPVDLRDVFDPNLLPF